MEAGRTGGTLSLHLVLVQHFTPEPRLTPDQLLAEHVHEVRWWTRNEMAVSDGTFSPRALPTLIEELLSRGVPDEPIALTGL